MIKNKHFIWNAVGTILNSFLSLFLLIIVTRINKLEVSGTFSFLFTVTLLFQMISTYGGRIFQVSDLNNEFTFQEYLGSRIKTSLASIAILIIFILFYKCDYVILGTLLCLVALRILETFSDIFYGSFQKNNHLDWVGISLSLKSILILLVFLILDILSKNLFIASSGIVVSSLIVFVFYDLSKIKKLEKLHFEFNSLLYNKSKYIFLFSFITLLILNIPRFVANYTLAPGEVGYLGILMMIPTVMALVCQFIIQPQIVNLTKYYFEKNIKSFNSILKKSFVLLLGFCMICSILAITIGPFVLNILYGISFEKYRLAFLVLILAGTFNSITNIFSNILTIFRETKQQFIIYSIILIVNLFITTIISNFYGLNGLLFGLMFVMLIQCFCFYLVYKSKKLKSFY